MTTAEPIRPTDHDASAVHGHAEPISESAYLNEQAAAAQAAVLQTITDIKARLLAGADVRPLLRKLQGQVHDHPWLMMGASTVAAFALTMLLVPSRADSALKRLAEVERLFNRPIPPHPQSEAGGESASARDDKPSIMATVLKEGIALLRPVLASVIAAQVGQHQADPPSGDGAEHGQPR